MTISSWIRKLRRDLVQAKDEPGGRGVHWRMSLVSDIKFWERVLAQKRYRMAGKR